MSEDTVRNRTGWTLRPCREKSRQGILEDRAGPLPC